MVVAEGGSWVSPGGVTGTGAGAKSWLVDPAVLVAEFSTTSSNNSFVLAFDQ